MQILTFETQDHPRHPQPLRWLGRLLIAGAIGAAALAAAGGTSYATGQLIPIKTVPVASGDQFRIHPASRPGMAGAGLAVHDSLGDPFRNPALGGRAPGVFFGAPVRYHISDDNGSGNSLPLGAHLRSGSVFGSVSFALQQVSAARTGFTGPFCDFCDFVQEPLSRSAARNVYLFGSLGRELESGTSLGASISFSDLRWISGIEHLYAGSTSIEPSGHTLDLRAGLHRNWADGRELEAVIVHNRVDMEHDVTYVDFLFLERPFVDPLPPDFPPPQRVVTREQNLDRTHTWGVETRYLVPVADSPWRLATSATINRKNHPKIPNYRIQNIPRDPGETWAFGLGLGAARSVGSSTFAADVLYQPIWSNTWQEADVAIQDAAGSTIPIGGRTIENDFVFSNLTLRMGVDREMSLGDVQFGIEARSISYTLDQIDRIQGIRRDQRESWIEWTPTLSLGIGLEELELRYFGKVTSGSGLPGIGGFDRFAADAPAAPDIIAAAQGPLTLADSNVWTHQFMVVIPFRSR